MKMSRSASCWYQFRGWGAGRGEMRDILMVTVIMGKWNAIVVSAVMCLTLA
jgi:hypothetical protein